MVVERVAAALGTAAWPAAAVRAGQRGSPTTLWRLRPGSGCTSGWRWYRSPGPCRGTAGCTRHGPAGSVASRGPQALGWAQRDALPVTCHARRTLQARQGRGPRPASGAGQHAQRAAGRAAPMGECSGVGLIELDLASADRRHALQPTAAWCSGNRPPSPPVGRKSGWPPRPPGPTPTWSRRSLRPPGAPSRPSRPCPWCQRAGRRGRSRPGPRSAG